MFGHKRRQEKSRTREDKRRTRPGHTVQGRGQSVCPGLVSAAKGQEKDKKRTTAGQEKDKRRTRLGHRARPQSSGARPGPYW